jgi:hypothetical protein
MKKLLIALLFVGAIIFSSCSDDCDCPSGPSETEIAH